MSQRLSIKNSPLNPVNTPIYKYLKRKFGSTTAVLLMAGGAYALYKMIRNQQHGSSGAYVDNINNYNYSNGVIPRMRNDF